MSRCTVAGSCRFLSTLSLRRATGAEIQDPGQVLFLSTLSLRRATLSKDAKDGPVLISLHALLTESDAKLTQKFEIRSKFLSTLSLRRATKRVQVKARLLQISIHALLTESDSKWSILKSRRMVFLSTLSLRRATHRAALCYNRPNDFYPRSPYGERPPSMIRQPTPTGFLSTLSLRRATARPRCYPVGGNISIHALLTESDALY